MDRVCYINALGQGICRGGSGRAGDTGSGRKGSANLLERQLVGRRIVAFRKTRHSSESPRWRRWRRRINKKRRASDQQEDGSFRRDL